MNEQENNMTTPEETPIQQAEETAIPPAEESVEVISEAALPAEEQPQAEGSETEAAAPSEQSVASTEYAPPQTPYRWDYQNYEELEKANNKRKNKGGRVALIVFVAIIVIMILGSITLWQNYLGGVEPASEKTKSVSSASESASPAPEIVINGDNSGETSSSDTTDTFGNFSAADIAEKVRSSVVGVCAYVEEYPFTPSGEGSGIIASADGYIITNYHVIAESDQLVVVLDSGEKYAAKLVGGDSYTDLAVLKINAKDLPSATFGDPTKMRVGDYVLAIGNPGGLEFAGSVTMGIVSALDRPISTTGIEAYCIQTDAAINPGNSGGALVNTKGEVVGINSCKIVAEGYEGMGFAISMSEAKPILDDLMKYGKVQNRVRLGISVQELDATYARYYKVPSGLVVIEIDSSSAAYKAGLRKGDIITELDGTELQFSTDLLQLLYQKKPGQTVTLQVYRADALNAGKSLNIKVKLEQTTGK